MVRFVDLLTEHLQATLVSGENYHPLFRVLPPQRADGALEFLRRSYPCYGCPSVVRFIRTYPDGTFLNIRKTMSLALAISSLFLQIVPAATGQAPRELRFQAPKTPPANLSAIRSSLEQSVLSDKLPSFAVCVVQSGRTIWDEAFGWADREKKIKASCDTLYPVASVSKAFTATGVFILAQRGLIKLDRPVQDYLGPVRLKSLIPGVGSPSVLEILNMTGGIPHYAKYYWDQASERPTTPAMLERYASIAFPPGKYFHYSNLSYSLAEQVIAQVTGGSFEEWMRRDLFHPLGMERTLLRVPPGLKNETAKPYDSGNRRAPDFDFYPKGGAGFYSTAHDLVRFGMCHLGQSLPGGIVILIPAQLQAIHRVTNPPSVMPRYANGWGVLDFGAKGSALVSNGEILGASATLVLLPTRGVAIACLSNVNVEPRISDTVAFQIADVLSPGFEKDFESAKTAFEAREKATEPLAGLKGHWHGHIATPGESMPFRLRVESDGTTSVQFKDQREVALEQVRFNGKMLQGSFAGKAQPTQPGTEPPEISIELYKDRDALEGVVTFTTSRKPGLVEAPAFVQKQ